MSPLGRNEGKQDTTQGEHPQTTGMLYFTRHGETLWNLEGRFQGRGNSELTERGKMQAARLGAILDEEGIDLVVSSPLGRARHTAQLALGERSIPLLFLNELMEMDLGAWEGCALAQLKELEPENFYRYWHKPFDYVTRRGESFEALITRVRQALQKLVPLSRGRRVLVVTHGMTLMALVHLLSGDPLEDIIVRPVLAQTSITRVAFTCGTQGEACYRIQSLGDTRHFLEEV
ncbi:hypothetical protein ABB02_01055 [Clostridiaceae bacterium JG1575]|nr:hypothetical protein ABB02_01055 [Clostridiaceae bacterium JG1575]